MREEEKKRTSLNSKFQQVLRKRWVFPAIYLVSAAVILTGVLWYQAARDTKHIADNPSNTNTSKGHQSVEVNKGIETVSMPVLDKESVKVVTNFYDVNASKEAQVAALVSYNNTYRPNKGIDIANKDGKEFDVTASLSGTVTKAEKDPVLGSVVEIKNANGVVTMYQSLSSVDIQKGDKVAQNEIIGRAGKSLYNQKAGVHVHFEIRKDGKAVNPSQFIDKPATAITDKVESTKAVDGKAKEKKDSKSEKKSAKASDESASA
ncbi:M23 family metallopeptidase [Metabacillus sp. GX 13764]|uniref:M23 family metallopeptidase n=1 Tax=Metabacillus kandeliae TaxID=2900151 RepID=UPI001E44488C|nr:M23 family metallopeptidase [Metabacillus kandeliae]MCD7034637.1 M23 family metallopeptidase [Metabacillus kandeliae]